MQKYSVFSLIKNAFSNHENWEIAWKDPNPKPVIEKHGKVFVVRDDLLDAGTKIRAIDFLISSEKDVEEWVFGSSPAHGYGQISLAHVCRKYGKKAVLFMAERSPEKYHAYQKKGIALGAEYHWVPNGMLVVTQKRARDYVDKDPKRRRLLHYLRKTNLESYKNILDTLKIRK